MNTDQLYTFRKLSRNTYLLDLNPMVRKYIALTGYKMKTLAKIDVWVAAVKGGKGGRWGRTVACGATEAEVRRAVNDRL